MPRLPITTEGYESQGGAVRSVPSTDVFRAPRLVNPGEGIAEATAAVAGVVQKIERDRETQALTDYEIRMAEAERRITLGDEQTPGALVQKGRNAAGTTARARAELEKEFDRLLPKLRTPEAQARAQQLRKVRLEDAHERLWKNEVAETEVATRQTALSALETYAIEAHNGFSDRGIVEASLARTRGVIAAEAARQGLDEGSAKLWLAKQESTVLRGVAERMLVADPFAAASFVDNEARLLPEDRLALIGLIQPVKDDAEDAAWVADVVSGKIVAINDATPEDVATFQQQTVSVAEKHGFRVKSIERSAAENAAVGGAARSRHLDGAAIDLSIRGKSQAQIDAVTAEMHALGYVGGYHSKGTAPHLHFQMPGKVTRSAQPVPPATKGDAMAALLALPPHLRRRKAQYLSDHFELAAEQQRVATAAASASMFERVFAARGSGQPLSKVLSPQEFRLAVEKGWDSKYDSILKPGGDSPFDLGVVGQLDALAYRAAAGDHGARRELAAVNPFDPRIPLTLEQRRHVAERQEALAKNDPEKIADMKFVGEQVNRAMFQAFGHVDASPKAKSPEAKVRNEFTARLGESIEKFKARTGKPPTEDEVQHMADFLLLGQGEDRAFLGGVPNARNLVVPAADRLQILVHLPNATEAQIVSAYAEKLRRQGAPK